MNTVTMTESEKADLRRRRDHERYMAHREERCARQRAYQREYRERMRKLLQRPSR